MGTTTEPISRLCMRVRETGPGLVDFSKMPLDKVQAFGLGIVVWVITLALFGYGGIVAGGIVGLRLGIGTIRGRRSAADSRQRGIYVRDIGQLERLVELGVDFGTALGQIGSANGSSATMNRTAVRLRGGATVEQAMQRELNWGNENMPGLEMLARLVPTLLITGAPIIPVLRRIVRHAESAEQLRQQKQTLASQGRMQARVMLALPVVLLPTLMAMDQRIFVFYHDSFSGSLVLAFAAFILLLAYGWMQRIIGTGE